MSNSKKPKIKLGPEMAMAIKSEKLNINYVVFHKVIGKYTTQIVVAEKFLHDKRELMLFQSLCN